MVAFVTSLVLGLLAVGVVFWYGRRRPVGASLSWGEAFLAATFMFALMLLLYGIVPNQWLLWADNELGWRSDSIGVPTPFGRLFASGLEFGGRGRVMITAETVRDAIAALLYVVFLVGQVVGWKMWQQRGKKPAAPAEIPTSAYGRPLVRKV